MRISTKEIIMYLTVSMMLCGVVCGSDLHVLTYNIHSGKGTDNVIDLPRLAKVIKSFSPDIVSLQEVDKLTTRSGKVDQAEELARLTGMNFIFGVSQKRWGGEYGNAVLSRFPMTESNVIALPGEPRSALCVKIDLSTFDDGPDELLFVATHMDTKQEHRLAGLPLLETGVSVYDPSPMIMAGDFNALVKSPTMNILERKWMVTTAGESLVTIPAKRKWSAAQIDYILCRSEDNWVVIENRVVENLIASDHFPLLSVLKYRGE